MSTDDFQDRVTSLRWQLEVAVEVIADSGRIVAEYFDVGYSRRRPWPQRPQAAALLAAAADPHRGFDAVVVGEFERAFYAGQLPQIAATNGACLARPPSTRRETGTALRRGGRCGRWRRFWPIRATRAGRCGTAQRTDHARSRDGSLVDGRVVHRWNPASDWVTSKGRAHEPLISEDEFRRVQQISAAPVARDGRPRCYRFVGLLRCALCGRSLHSHWLHGRPGYRCGHGTTSARPNPHNRPRSIYLREDALVARLVALVGEHYPEPISIEQLAHYVRDNHMMIICDGTTLRLDSDDVYRTQPALFAV
jgi:hypothetical protein